MASRSRSTKKIKNIKVAIVHDILIEYGGAERVLEELISLFPKADLHTLYFNKNDNLIFSGFEKAKPRTSFLQKIPKIYLLKHYFSMTKLVSWLYFLSLDLSLYDLIITSSHSYNSKLVRKAKRALHVCYMHTPPKYLYEEKSEIGWIKSFPFNFFLSPFIAFLRFIDKKAAHIPDILIANSNLVKKRIKKYYQRSSLVIHPPVRIPKRVYGESNRNYFLFLSRLVRQKGPELAVSTATKYGLPLLVVGEGHLRKTLKRISGSTVKFLGRIPDSDMSGVFRKAKALIYCATDEDFGIVPVEAMANGVPVVAYKSGAVIETVVDGISGVLFDSFTEKSLYKAIKKFEKLNFKPSIIQSGAKKFSRDNFGKKFLEVVVKNL